VLVEDTALVFPALGNLPGPLIKWFFEELGNDGLCRLLNGYSTRRAVAQVIFGLTHDGTTVHFFEGKIAGRVADHPRGSKGFGWDPVFIPRGYEKTWAQMSQTEQRETSMRRIGLEKLGRYLKSSRIKT
jgi:non-canonical purine NTP pyrophosphatase (RdgB/HAM1 family)